MSPQVVEVIERYRNALDGEPSQKAEADRFAKLLTRKIGPPSPQRAKDLLYALTRLGLWCQQVCIPLEPKQALHPNTIERFAVDAQATVPAGTRRTVRANLRFCGQRLVPELWPTEPPRIPRTPVGKPYADVDIDAYIDAARAVPSDRLRHALLVIIGLCAGAGLAPGDLRHLYGHHVRRHAGRVVVDVPGARSRTVPVMEPYDTLLADAATTQRSEPLLGRNSHERRNVTGDLVLEFARFTSLPRLDVRRLRDTWIQRQVDFIGLKHLCSAMGLPANTRVLSVLKNLPEPSLEDVIRALPASRDARRS